MSRLFVIAAAALILGAAAYWSSYLWMSTPENGCPMAPSDELAWMREDLELSPEELRGIAELHEAFMPRCAALCERLEAARAEVDRLMVANRAVTPELVGALAHLASTEAACREATLAHIYAVAARMPPPQAEHYLRVMSSKLYGAGAVPRTAAHPQP